MAQKARDAGVLRALAHVVTPALVDEATGYEEVRVRNELHRILDAYIAEELLPWTKRFPDEFYRQLVRLRGWHTRPCQSTAQGYRAHHVRTYLRESTRRSHRGTGTP